LRLLAGLLQALSAGAEQERRRDREEGDAPPTMRPAVADAMEMSRPRSSAMNSPMASVAAPNAFATVAPTREGLPA
jgi:hypothetical protein